MTVTGSPAWTADVLEQVASDIEYDQAAYNRGDTLCPPDAVAQLRRQAQLLREGAVA